MVGYFISICIIIREEVYYRIVTDNKLKINEMEKDFINNFKNALEIVSRDVNMSDEFRTFEEWDSLAYLSIIAMLDEEYNTQIEEDEFKKLKTVNDIYSKIQF